MRCGPVTSSVIVNGPVSHGRDSNRPRRKREGAILIITLGVLTLLSILGIAFASLMRLERKAAENYVDGKRMDMLLDSALDRVVASLYGAKNWRSYTVYQDTPWLNLLGSGRRGGGGERDLAHGRADVDDPRVGGLWEIFSQEEGQRGSYKAKVIDCSSQLNLNGQQDTLARMLDNLGQAIERSVRLKLDGKNPRNPFFEGPNRSGNQVRGADIVRFRRLLPEGRFTTKAQLRWLIGQENFETLKDFVTCHSWEDPYTFKATDGLDQVSIFRGVTSGGGGLGGGGAQQTQPSASDTPRIDSESRFPININTAPEEVLITCLQGLAGRRVFPYSRLGSGGGGMVPIDQNAQVVGERIFGNEEIQNVTPRGIFVYGPRLEYEQAKRMADRIIAQRKVKPFMAWRTNDIGLPGFEDFVDTQLDTGFFPPPSQAIVIDPEQTQNRRIEADVLNNATSLVGRLWRRGHDNRERQIRRQKGLPMHDLNAWYYEMMKGILKANFNPNTRLNRYNPNAPAFNPVDKSDLVWAQTRQELFKGHTTEFCFDTMGFYEITTLGRYEPVAAPKPQKPRTSSSARSAIGAAMNTGPQLFVRPFDRKTRTVVKTFDVLRHTSQFHFERTFTSQARSSKNDRKYIVTFPEPAAALTELYSSGSLRDGRVELAGLLDGERLQVDVRSRAQLYRTHPSVLMAHGFQDRDAQSINTLQRVLRSGGGVSLLGDEVSDALKDVFDANFSRMQSINARFVRRKQLVALGGVLSQQAIHSDPLVQREVLGNDLQPDGLHTSILRMSHLQLRHLILPARQAVGQAGQFGGGNPLYGATGVGSRGQNIIGNVPYHRGGLAFWVKFDFDARDPVFSGLIGCTSVVKEVVPSPTDWRGSEGVQFFIFKNSDGFLRITRMYYHQAFYSTGGGEGGGGGGGGGQGVQLYPDALAAEGGLGSNPIQDNLDPKKLISRSDIILDIRHIRAHEWHHIAVDWDDQTNPTFPIRLYLDFQEVREGGTPRRAQAVVDGRANSWVRLNERQPRDGLQVGGIIRNQGVADAGLFKWYTNTTSTSSGGGIQTVAESVKRIIANATIDELITYEGDFTGAKQYYAASGSPGYFTTQVGEYANLFEIPLSPNVDSVILRSFDWTSYYPVMFTDSRPSSVPTQVRVTPIDCQIFYLSSRPPPSNFQEPWRQPSVLNRVAGRRAFRSRSGLQGRNVEMVYKFSLSGARSNSGNSAGGVVQTPSIDDVTLTYYLSSPNILLQEELD